jgi:ABC-2 type transport system ATP-binding protein
MKSEHIIDVQGLTKRFEDKTVVNQIDISVKKGEVFGFLGPNGSGKTTTIRMLCGLLIPDAGKGHCLGFDIVKESDKIKQYIGYMTQKFSFYTDLSVEENLSFIARVYQVKDIKNAVHTTLKNLGLLKRKDQLTGELSGGWKQRLALAACLLHSPKLLLLDEPTAGVDPIARREFWDSIHALSEHGITTLVSTHYMDEAERCTRLAYIAHGDMLVTGNVSDIIHATRLVGFEIIGNISTHILQLVQKLPNVVQAAYFGNRIHVCGFDKNKILAEVTTLNIPNIQFNEIEVSLEDAFIGLVKKSTLEH